MTSQKGTATELGTERIGKLLMQYAIPAIIAMTASSLYNMVDSIFIGHGVGPLAISGLAITFPLMNLAAAFGSLVGVGASTLISVKLGQKDYVTAQQILGNVVSLNLIIGILFTLVCLLFLDPILYFFGASDATLPYARDYMITILLGNVITHMYLGLNSVLRSAGHPQKAMAATILTVVINTLLDPLFIYTFHMGIQGAAIATVLAQVISLCWLIKIFCNKNELLHLKRGIYRLKTTLVENIIGIGLAPFFMNLASCFIVILINKGFDARTGRIGLYNGCTAHTAERKRIAGGRPVFPHHRFSDGDLQLLPKHRYGQESHHPFSEPTGPDSDSLPANSSSLLGSRRRVVQHADFRYHSQYHCRHHALCPIQTIQATTCSPIQALTKINDKKVAFFRRMIYICFISN